MNSSRRGLKLPTLEPFNHVRVRVSCSWAQQLTCSKFLRSCIGCRDALAAGVEDTYLHHSSMLEALLLLLLGVSITRSLGSAENSIDLEDETGAWHD
jgi:hypothetical protein